jgi:alpha-D-glucose phosphate-specific phosphoglucomutase
VYISVARRASRRSRIVAFGGYSSVDISVTTLLWYDHTFPCRHASARDLLVNIPWLVSAYYTYKPDASIPEQQVAFGTSGHRGSSLQTSFNEDHILAICQAIAEWRRTQRITGPLYLGMDTHALSEPALATAIEVFAANAADIFVQSGLGYTPTPAVSHVILTYNRGRTSGLADSVAISPSHNPLKWQVLIFRRAFSASGRAET